ncbi:YeeE/YedE family protein [Flexithrix dorotheae]|uniref:YeeE/YedE family protein n=1 Tax=Flexithrix dorotheae TaxID=70993 RepID=UPI00035DB128|nr:YeeE/YedE thiosulfate transporter family protein [Flexithrix dorotheae]
MIDLIKQPWPWYVSGPLIALVMGTLLYFGKTFGVSSNLRTMCSIMGAGKKVEFFNFNWKENIWNLLFIFGSVIGGFIGHFFLSTSEPVAISTETVQDLAGLGIANSGTYVPTDLFSWSSLFTLKGAIMLIGGGFLIGFGTRYAGGCTSGHAITGLSNLQLPSLIAVVGFFIGGLLMTHILMPIILSL